MSRRMLVVAGATLDSLEGSGWRPGGPGLYAAAAARLLGCIVDVAGPLGADDAWAIARAYRRVGAGLLGPTLPGCAFRFHHRYTPRGRQSRLECAPRAVVDGSGIAGLASRYQALLVSPVFCEVSPEAASTLAVALPSMAKALDVQGFVRCLGSVPTRAVSGYMLVHASDDDMPEPPVPRGGIVAYTRGWMGGVILGRRGVEARIPRPPRILGDPTGAGDAFTASMLCLISEGLHFAEAADLAVEATLEAIEAVHAQGF